MRGMSSTWWRIRINLQHVPEDLRPAQEALDPDSPDLHWSWGDGKPPARRRSQKGET
jgi:hypothetical protein